MGTDNMNRSIWKFPYTAGALLAAVEAKLEFHKSRLQVWTIKRDETKAKIKEHGIDFDESLADQMQSYSNSFAGRGNIKIDTKLSADFFECKSKVDEHTGKVKEYEGWVQVLAVSSKVNPMPVFELHQDDWLFFFGK